jgi:methylmalonyl-CoA mutase, N-terminal domain
MRALRAPGAIAAITINVARELPADRRRGATQPPGDRPHTLPSQQPLNNVVRTTIEALAGVLGGTQSLHTNSFDEALALPSEQAVKLAVRTQQIIAEQTGVTNTVDPLGGSYFVEALTGRMEEMAYDYFRRIDELGGMVEAVKQGFPQCEIADAAFALQTEIDAKQRIPGGCRRGHPLRRPDDVGASHP